MISSPCGCILCHGFAVASLSMHWIDVKITLYMGRYTKLASIQYASTVMRLHSIGCDCRQGAPCGCGAISINLGKINWLRLGSYVTAHATMDATARQGHSGDAQCKSPPPCVFWNVSNSAPRMQPTPQERGQSRDQSEVVCIPLSRRPWGSYLRYFWSSLSTLVRI